MKKHLHNSLRALFLSLAVLLSLPMLAVEVEIDGINYELNADAKQATVIKKSSGTYSGEVVIPESVEHESAAYSVTSIGDNAFSGCSGLTSVTIPNSVKSIGSSAFRYCDGLTSVHISDIAAWCNIDFDGAYSNPLYYAHHLYLNGEEVKDLVIPNSVTSIGGYAFRYCSGLTSVTIGNSVTSIGEYAFSGCSGLTSVTIPNSVTSIGSSAFDYCPGLTSVHISDIAAWCNIDFDGAYSNPLYYAYHLYLNGEEVKDLVIPNSVTSIGDWAFCKCSGLTSVTIGNSVTSIGNSAFWFCSGLTSVTIPNSVTSIGDDAFYECSGLTSVHISDIAAWCNIEFGANYSNPLTYAHHLYLNGEEVKDLVIPNSVTSIGQRAFDWCSGLTSVTIPNSVTSIGDNAFYECSGLTSVTIGNSVTSIGKSAFSYCSGLTSVTIPNSVTSIGDYAFSYSGLTSVTIGNSVKSIGGYAFSGCSGLTSVHISDIAAWCNIEFSRTNSNPLYYAQHLYLNGEEVKDLVIPNSVTSIGKYAFRNCSGLTSVTIPNSVSSIGDYAFGSCSGLTSVTIGSGVKSIGYWAFEDCSELLDVYCYAENVPSTQSNAFSSSPIADATLHVPNASINSYKASAPWSSFGKIVGLSKEYSLTVSSVGYATLFLDFNAEIPAAVQAYTVVKVVGNRLKMERVEGVLPANTGVIIKAEEGTYTFAESDATPATIGDNLLYGTVATTQISTDPTYSYYVLSKVDGIVGMYLAKLTDGKFQNNANKAYMMLKKGDLGIYDEGVDTGTEQLSRGFVFDFDDETGITETEIGSVKSENSAIFDLSGRRVQNAQKGIFIRNGKVVVK